MYNRYINNSQLKSDVILYHAFVLSFLTVHLIIKRFLTTLRIKSRSRTENRSLQLNQLLSKRFDTN